MRTPANLTLVALLTASLPFASKAQETKRVDIPMSFPILLSGHLVQPATRLSLADSLARLAYKRQKVKTVAKFQLRPGRPADTLEIKTFDQWGNTVMSYEPKFAIRVTKDYNGQSQLIKATQQISNDRSWLETIDPQSKQYMAWQVDEANDRHLLRSATQRIQGDTAINQTLLNAPLIVRGQAVNRVVGRYYPTGRDTMQHDIAGYNEANEVVATENSYAIRRNGLVIELGRISYEKAMDDLFDTSSQARQWRSQGITDAAIRQRLPRQLSPTYLPTTYCTYNQAGQLTLTTDQNPANPKAVDIHDGSHLTASVIASSSSSQRYSYDKKGQLILQETKASFPAVEDQPAKSLSVVTKRVFSPKGLVLHESVTQNTSEAGVPAEQVVTNYGYHYRYY